MGMSMKIMIMIVIPLLCMFVCLCVWFQGDANRSEADEDRQSLTYEDEEKLRELYAAGTNPQAQKYILQSPTIALLDQFGLLPVGFYSLCFHFSNWFT